MKTKITPAVIFKATEKICSMVGSKKNLNPKCQQPPDGSEITYTL